MEMHDYSKVDSSEILYEEPDGGLKTTPDDGNNAGEQSSSACANTSEYERVGSYDVERREPTHIYTNYTNDAEQSLSPAEVTRSSFKCSKLLCLTITVVLLLIAFASAASYVTYLTLRLSALEETVTERLTVPSPDQYQAAQQELSEALNALNMSIGAQQGSILRHMQAQAINITIHLTTLFESDVRAKNQDLENRLSSQIHSPGNTRTYEDCHAAWEQGARVAGVYRLSPGQLQPFNARCEFDHRHGWTVFQRRFDGSVNFYLPWDSYKRGFGSPHGEYWLGNEKIFSLTRRNRKLSIYLMRWDGDEATANYSKFYISNESDNYRLNISGYSGNAGHDGMAHSNGHQFSTRDRDNDAWISLHCADNRKGAWWYNECATSNLNGLYTNSSTGNYTNMYWDGDWSGGWFRPLRKTSMMLTRD